jgi:hypothetical protein
MPGLNWFLLRLTPVRFDWSVDQFNLRLNLAFPTRRIPVAFRRKSHFSLALSAWYITVETRSAMKKAAPPSILVVMILLAVAVIAEAQQPNKVPRVGYLAGVSPSTIAARTQAFREGLRELGYVEGKTLWLSGDTLRTR